MENDDERLTAQERFFFPRIRLSIYLLIIILFLPRDYTGCVAYKHANRSWPDRGLGGGGCNILFVRPSLAPKSIFFF